MLLVLLVAGAIVVREARRAFTDELKSQIEESIEVFRDVHAAAGRDGLARAVSELSDFRPVPQHLSGVFLPDGTQLAGRLGKIPPTDDWTEVELENPLSGKAERFLVRRVDLGDAILVSGRSLRLIDRAVGQMQLVLPALWLFLLVGIGAAGVIVHRALAGELMRIESVLRRFAAGDMESRVDLEGAPRDGIEEIGALVNRHLDDMRTSIDAIERTGAAIAHDLRTPLTRVSLKLQALAADPAVPEGAVGTLDAATAELQALSQTCDAILRISAIETSHSEAAFTRFDLAALAREVCESYAPVLEDAGYRLIGDLPGETVPVRADRRMIGQTIVNLVTNVMAHCPKGTTATVSVAAWQDDAILTVADDGPGVPETELERIFEPFRRLDESRSKGGTGLGLALVRAVARHHDARLKARNLSPGLAVELVLPLAQGEAPSTPLHDLTRK